MRGEKRAFIFVLPENVDDFLAAQMDDKCVW
jgi:hypothetical protein